ncbi:HutD family protein [Streptomyces sp. NPDC002262]|uniref:HutD family protein n=1 Tax=Streptomyces sp. NPDC002262 TaxID=3154414 RepID=UPI00332299DC
MAGERGRHRTGRAVLGVPRRRPDVHRPVGRRGAADGPGALDRTVGAEEPLAFPGELEPAAALRGGACRVLNLMVRRGRWTVRVERVTGPVVPPRGHAGVLHVLRGRWRAGDGGPVPAAGQGVWWDAGDGAPGRGPVPLSPGAVALWADLAPLGPDRPARGGQAGSSSMVSSTRSA